MNEIAEEQYQSLLKRIYYSEKLDTYFTDTELPFAYQNELNRQNDLKFLAREIAKNLDKFPPEKEI